MTAGPLPTYLVRRYRGWRATTYRENQGWYRQLAEEGQHPRAMVISCCDSRVHATALFGADQGEFFMHRNVANLVHPYLPDGMPHGTSAAIEYAVCVLKVAHLIVLGHSHCGGIKGCMDMCEGRAPQLDARESFVGRWMEMLRPHFDAVKDIADDVARARAFEKQGVIASLGNLMTFPFVASAVANGALSLHGLWNEIGTGGLEWYDSESGVFVPL